MNRVSRKIRVLCASAEEGCRRLVDTVGLPAERAGVRLRLFGTLVAAPAVAASAASLTLSQNHGPAMLAAANILIIGLCWLAGLFVAAHGREKTVGALSLGMATIAGTVMALYASILEPTLPGAAGHVLAASLMNAPAALLLARLAPQAHDLETGASPHRGGCRRLGGGEHAHRLSLPVRSAPGSLRAWWSWVFSG